jgi:DNA-binding transcriptional regulator YdaS (Cro superfamily)
MQTTHNMHLREWLKANPGQTLTALARQLGVGRVYLTQLVQRTDGRVPSPQLCVQIERATGGKVTRAELRPDDFWLIWPDLPAPAKEAA